VWLWLFLCAGVCRCSVLGAGFLFIEEATARKFFTVAVVVSSLGGFCAVFCLEDATCGKSFFGCSSSSSSFFGVTLVFLLFAILCLKDARVKNFFGCSNCSFQPFACFVLRRNGCCVYQFAIGLF